MQRRAHPVDWYLKLAVMAHVTITLMSLRAMVVIPRPPTTFNLAAIFITSKINTSQLTIRLPLVANSYCTQSSSRSGESTFRLASNHTENIHQFLQAGRLHKTMSSVYHSDDIDDGHLFVAKGQDRNIT